MKKIIFIAIFFSHFHAGAQLTLVFPDINSFTDFYSEHYRQFGSNPGGRHNFNGYHGRNNSSGQIYQYSYQDYLSGQGPRALSPHINGSNAAPEIDGVFGGYLCCFYNSLPSTIGSQLDWSQDVPESIIITRFEANPVPNQQPIFNTLTELYNSEFIKDPLIEYGLEDLNATIIEDLPPRHATGSPTFFSRRDMRLNVNEVDLEEYGFVVLLHESLHASLQKALQAGVISNTQYEKVALLNKTHFGKFDGYIGSNGYPVTTPIDGLHEHLNLIDSEMLGMEKAFTIGYTYQLIKKNYNKLNSQQKVFAKRFTDDVDDNIYLTRLELCPGFTVGCRYRDLHIIDSNATQTNINFFTSSFTNQSSSVNKVISPVKSSIVSAVRRNKIKKIKPFTQYLLFN